MNKFEKQLEKWNNGVLRGAQAKLAKILDVSTATTALWATGKRHPSKGYIARMAELFNIDVFDVLKLFDNGSTTYPDPKLSHFAGALRDKEDDYVYNFNDEQTAKDASPVGNSVRLPFLNTIPENYPQYDESEIIEWWSIPRRYAQGAKYIVRSKTAGLPDAADEDDLCFIKPGADIAAGKTALLAEKKKTYAARIVKNKEKQSILYGTNVYPRILGTIVRRIHSV